MAAPLRRFCVRRRRQYNNARLNSARRCTYPARRFRIALAHSDVRQDLYAVVGPLEEGDRKSNVRS